jgi:hypothetical protein
MTRTMKTYSPLEPKAETQPKLQPALLRSSAMSVSIRSAQITGDSELPFLAAFELVCRRRIVPSCSRSRRGGIGRRAGLKIQGYGSCTCRIASLLPISRMARPALRRHPIKDHTESVLVIANAPAVLFGERRNRSFTTLTVGRPDTTQFWLVHGAVPGLL